MKLKKRDRHNRQKVARQDSLVKSEGGQTGKALDIAAVCLLVAVGLIYSMHFFRYIVFPNSDYAAFLETGQSWLRFEIPSSMKRAPLFSIITAVLAGIFRFPEGGLFSSNLYNALMLPVAMVLIYFLGKRLIGNAAVWVAILAGIIPWMVRLSSESLAEMTMVVCLAATALAVQKDSRWAYLFAMLGSMARWDLGALLPAVALIDLIRHRKWLRTIILASVASIPFIICMIITYLQLRQSPPGAHYLQVLSKEGQFELLVDLRLYWRSICSFVSAPLVSVMSDGRARPMQELNDLIFRLSAFLLAVFFLLGCVLTFVKKRWGLILLLAEAVPYVIVHAMYPYRLDRFCIPVAWAGMLIAAYGLISLWQWFEAKPKPKWIIPALQSAAIAIFVLWSIKAAQTLRLAGNVCPVIVQLVIISCVVCVVGFFVQQYIRHSKVTPGWFAVPAFMVLAIINSGTMTGFTMRDGQANANFRVLAQWFEKVAKDDEKIVTTMAGFGPLYTTLPRDRFIHTGAIDPKEAQTFDEFVQACYERGAVYIAWDSRLYGQNNDRYYKMWGLDRWNPLAAPLLGKRVTQIGRCRLVYLITEGTPKIAVWRILPKGD
jgi:hypothetical protein